ncbi:MAG: glycosyltransferase family 9 protein [Candidatus Omnitrophica bacterium]|nr:glycosyltransferase family 9 protein [Candidatus Omnitrophota bacterium]
MDRILVVLPNWFGETLFATPFLRELRRQRPDAWVATLGWPQCREVLLHNPHVQERLDYDERGAHRGLLAKWRLIEALRWRRFDTAFILRRSLSRSLLLVLARIPARVGFANPKSGWLLTQAVPSPAAPSSGRRPEPGRGTPAHKAVIYLRLLDAVGLSGGDAGGFDYTVAEVERQAARVLLSDVTAGGEPLVILHPGANWAHKRWAPERFAALGDRLAAERGARIAITGGPGDRALAEDIQRRMSQPVSVLAGHTGLRELAACLEQAQLVVANDTGVLHIAAALGRPLLALYGPTSPLLTGPLGHAERTVVLHHPDCCPEVPCYRPGPAGPAHPGMDAITVDEAYAAAVQLLDQHG